MTLPVDGRLVDNIVHFARALRKAGIKVGSAQLTDAIRAVEATGFDKRADFHATLRATLIVRAEHLPVFDQLFSMFWRDPDYLGRMMHMLSPLLRKDEDEPEKKKTAARRAAEALSDGAAPPPAREREEVEIEAHLNWSANEVLRSKDFEQMSLDELAQARAALRSLTLPVPQILSRRRRPADRGAVDLRATLRGALRRGGDPVRLERRATQTRPPALVALCDISGSMTAYSRMMLQFLHGLGQQTNRDWGRVHTFTFGTRLTNVTRAMERKDPDAALEAAGRAAADWEGGTRIGMALDRFNRDWSRRVLAEGAAVLLITDGLERDDPALLSRAAERLHLSCRRLIWLNPLLRFTGFEAKAQGVQALLPHVDSFHSCHNVESLADLSRALSGSGALEALRVPPKAA